MSVRSTRTGTSAQTNSSDALGRSTPGRRPASQRIWKPLQIPRTRPPSAANAVTFLHRRREAGDSAAAQIVPVREPTGEDDGVHFGKLLVRVPDEPCVGSECGERPRRVTVVVRPREDDDPDARHDFAHSATSIS